jgi:hypothetical protein
MSCVYGIYLRSFLSDPSFLFEWAFGDWRGGYRDLLQNYIVHKFLDMSTTSFFSSVVERGIAAMQSS